MAAQQKVVDLQVVLDQFIIERDRAQAAVAAAAEQLSEAGVAVLGVEVRDDLLPRLAQARAEIATLEAALQAARQFYSAPQLPNITKKIALPVSLDYQKPERVAPPIMLWKEKFVALVQGDGG